METPCLRIDLGKIEHNARRIVGLCKQHGIEVAGVTKVTCGHPGIARAMLRGGVSTIADSRLENLQRLRADGVHTRLMLLRVPSLSQVEAIVQSADISLNTELSVLAALSGAALQRGRVHDVILMVDLGDRREGILPGDLVPFMAQARQLPGIRIRGLGGNLGCFAGVVPDEDNMQRLVMLGSEVGQRFDLELEWLSGINSSGLELIRAGRMPGGINHARIGEAIVLGRETTQHRPWPGTWQDAFILHAEILELKRKPSLPEGKRAEDAFGRRPQFEDRGEMLRALLNVGREDVDVSGIAPLDTRLTVLGASSGYLVIDATQAEGDMQVGDTLAFALNYSALLTAMTSGYVRKYAQTNPANAAGEG
jgi:predicted amino acid racemase